MNSLISLTFDDGLHCHFERALPILNELGFPATFFLVANTEPILTDGFEHPDWKKIVWSTEEIALLRKMIQQGHEIGSHSVHHLREFLDKDPNLEADESKQWMEKQLGSEISSYCYPFSYFTSRFRRAVVKAAYKQARWGSGGTYYPLRDSIDRFKVDCRHVGEHGSENVQDWVRPDSWHVLMFHGIGTLEDGWSPISEPEFRRQMEALATCRDTGSAEIVTFQDGAQRMSPIRSFWGKTLGLGA
jgi:peptidoglycan/xylan/chitin deacetylase (PgdA/CDA1 family)